MNLEKLGPRQIYDKYISNIPFQTKLAFLSALIVGIITHAYGFINLMPSFDGLQSTLAQTDDFLFQGRWFQKYAALITSQYNMPWVNGLVSVLLLAFSATIIIVLFKLKKTSSIILAAALIVSFPSITSCFSYLYMTDAFMVGVLFSVLAVYISRKHKKFGFLISSLLICLALGIYQAYICLTVALYVLLPIWSILKKEKTNKEVIIQGVKDILSLVIGVGIYYIILKILLNYNDVELTSYQNIDQLNNIQVLNFLPRIKEAYDGFIDYFKDGLFYYYSTFEAIVNIGVALLCAIYALIIFIKQKIYKNLLSSLLLVVLVILAPLAIYSIGLISAQGIHYLMILPISLIYIFFIRASEEFDFCISSKRINIKVVSQWSAIVLAVVLFYSNFIFANKSYFALKVRYNQTYAYAIKLSATIEDNDDYSTKLPIAVIGYSDIYHYLKTPLTGFNFKNRYMINKPISFYNFMWDYIGTSYRMASDEQLEMIKETDEYKAMPVYPQKGSMKAIDGIFVVKLK